jgi:homoserine kinase
MHNMEKPSMSYVRVFAPATVANVVCGFDVLGFAVETPGDEVELFVVSQPGVRLRAIYGDEGRLPLDPAKNTVSASVMRYLQQIGREDLGIEIVLHKHMPVGSGLGSSAASTVAGLFAIHQLMEQPLSTADLLQLAMEGEQLACGQGHADNVAPALLGGFVLIRSYHPLDVIQLPTPESLVCGLLHPHIEIQTRDARKILKPYVALSDVTTQMGNLAGFISALYNHDFGLLSRSMHDVIIEPVRSILIPEYQTLKSIALSSGALGFGISGSGPSVFALCEHFTTAQTIVSRLQAHLQQHHIASDVFTSPINRQGPRLLAIDEKIPGKSS